MGMLKATRHSHPSSTNTVRLNFIAIKMLSWLPLNMKKIYLEAHTSSSATPALKGTGLHVLTWLGKVEKMGGKLLDKICNSEQFDVRQTWMLHGYMGTKKVQSSCVVCCCPAKVDLSNLQTKFTWYGNLQTKFTWYGNCKSVKHETL